MVNEFSLKSKTDKQDIRSSRRISTEQRRNMVKQANATLATFKMTFFMLLCLCLIGCYGDETSRFRIKSSA